MKDSIDRERTAFDLKDDVLSDRWCRCCPLTLPVVTFIAIVIGLLSGWFFNAVDLNEKWAEGCYSSNEIKKDTTLTYMKVTVMEIIKTTTKDENGEDVETVTEQEKDLEIPTGVSSVTKPPSYQSCWIEIIDYPGMLWIRALKLVVTPLIAAMMLLIPSKINSLGAVGQRVAALLLFTSSIAAIEGLIWANIIQPGNKINDKTLAAVSSSSRKGYVSEMEAFLNIGTKFVPLNIVDDMANMRVLGVISFFLSFGYFMERDVPNEWKAPVLNAARAFLRASLNVLMIIMWCMPIAMWSILATKMFVTDLDAIIGATALYLLTQLVAQFVHLVGFYFIFFFAMTRRNPVAFFAAIIKAPFTALLTSSSAATLPITLRENLKERGDNAFAKKVCEFVIPLGATINMDGTSLGFPIMVLFVNQVGQNWSGDKLDGMPFGTMLLVALLSMTCSLGTAPIPNAGLVYLTMLLEAADINDPALQGMGIAMIVLVDWVVDRVETAQNVTSDSFISAIIAYSPLLRMMASDAAAAPETQLAENTGGSTGSA